MTFSYVVMLSFQFIISHTRMHAHTHTHTHTHTHICTHACMHTRTHTTHACTHTHTHTCMHASTHTHTHTQYLLVGGEDQRGPLVGGLGGGDLPVGDVGGDETQQAVLQDLWTVVHVVLLGRQLPSPPPEDDNNNNNNKVPRKAYFHHGSKSQWAVFTYSGHLGSILDLNASWVGGNSAFTPPPPPS